MTKTYYFANSEHSDSIYGDELPICIDLNEVNRLAREYGITTEEILDQMHEASESEIAEWGVYDA